jgi:hypothetical protein
MPIGLGALIGLTAGSKALGAIGGALGKKADQKAADKRAAADRAHEAALATQKLAADESRSNPFRHTLDQMGAASAFDRMANTSRRTVSIPGIRKEFMPQVTGGYAASDTLKGAATTARDAVLTGRGTAPSMTTPANYGQTGTLDLLALLQALGVDPNALSKLSGGGLGAPVGTPVNTTMPVPLDRYSYDDL